MLAKIPRTTGLGHPVSEFKARIVSLPCSCGHCVLSDLADTPAGDRVVKRCTGAARQTERDNHQCLCPTDTKSVNYSRSGGRQTPHQVCTDHQLGHPSRRSRRSATPHRTPPPTSRPIKAFSGDCALFDHLTEAPEQLERPQIHHVLLVVGASDLEGMTPKHAPPFVPSTNLAPTTVDGDSVADNALQKPNQASFIAVRESCNSSSRLRATAELKDSCLAPSASYLTMWSTLESPRKSRPSTSTRSPVRVPRTKTTFPWPSCAPRLSQHRQNP